MEKITQVWPRGSRVTFDPIEDTETLHPLVGGLDLRASRVTFDPIEDTETGRTLGERRTLAVA